MNELVQGSLPPQEAEASYSGNYPNVNGINPSTPTATVDPRDRMLWRLDSTEVDLRAAEGDSLRLGLSAHRSVSLSDDSAHDAMLPCAAQHAPKADQGDLVGLIYLAMSAWLSAGFPWCA